MLFAYLFIFNEKGRGREKERERNISVREKRPSAASPTRLDLGPTLKPRHEPRPGVEPPPFRFLEHRPNDRARWSGRDLTSFSLCTG